MSKFRITASPSASMLVSGWARSADKPRQPWRSAWIRTADEGTVSSIRVTVDLDDTTVTVQAVDERLKVLHFPTETVRHDIPAKDLFQEAERLLLDAACEQLRYAAAQTIEEVADRG